MGAEARRLCGLLSGAWPKVTGSAAYPAPGPKSPVPPPSRRLAQSDRYRRLWPCRHRHHPSLRHLVRADHAAAAQHAQMSEGLAPCPCHPQPLSTRACSGPALWAREACPRRLAAWIQAAQALSLWPGARPRVTPPATTPYWPRRQSAYYESPPLIDNLYETDWAALRGTSYVCVQVRPCTATSPYLVPQRSPVCRGAVCTFRTRLTDRV